MEDFGYPPNFPKEEEAVAAEEVQSSDPVIKDKAKGKKVNTFSSVNSILSPQSTQYFLLSQLNTFSSVNSILSPQ